MTGVTSNKLKPFPGERHCAHLINSQRSAHSAASESLSVVFPFSVSGQLSMWISEPQLLLQNTGKQRGTLAPRMVGREGRFILSYWILLFRHRFFFNSM